MVNFQWNQNRLLYSCQNKLLFFYSFLTLPPIHVQDLKRKYYETCMILWFYYFRIDPKSHINIRKTCVNLSPIFKEGFHCLTFILEYKNTKQSLQNSLDISACSKLFKLIWFLLKNDSTARPSSLLYVAYYIL